MCLISLSLSLSLSVSLCASFITLDSLPSLSLSLSLSYFFISSSSYSWFSSFAGPLCVCVCVCVCRPPCFSSVHADASSTRVLPDSKQRHATVYPLLSFISHTSVSRIIWMPTYFAQQGRARGPGVEHGAWARSAAATR